MAEVDILDLMRSSKRMIGQELGSYAGAPEEGGLPRWKHVSIHCYRCEDEHSYRETENRLESFREFEEGEPVSP